MGDRSDGLPRQGRRQAAYLGLEEHGDDPRSTSHSEIGSADGGPLLRLTKPVRATVLPRVRRRRAVKMAVADIFRAIVVFFFLMGLFLQMFLDRCALSMSLVASTCLSCNLTL